MRVETFAWPPAETFDWPLTAPQTPGTAKPTPQQLNKITTQLRDLNAAYQAAVAANGKAKAGQAVDQKPSK